MAKNNPLPGNLCCNRKGFPALDPYPLLFPKEREKAAEMRPISKYPDRRIAANKNQ